MTRREARRWVRQHWQEYMRSIDCPDLDPGEQAFGESLGADGIELIFEVFVDESLRLADRLEPRARSGR